MENQKFISPTRQFSSKPVGFGQVFRSKQQGDNTGASLSWPGSSWFFTCSLDWNWTATLLWCYWHHKECDGRAEKAVTKWFTGMFPTHLQLLSEMNSCIRKSSLNNCTVLYISEIKWFREYFEATTFTELNVRKNHNLWTLYVTRW